MGALKAAVKWVVKACYALLKKCPPMCILVVFALKIMVLGYAGYAGLKKRYGADCSILVCAYHGTGDYYICGMYLRAWLEKHSVKNYVFLTPGGSEEKITELFPVFKGRTHKVAFLPRFTYPTDRIKVFFGDVGMDMHFLNPLIATNGLSRIGLDSYLLGYNGLTMADHYLYVGLGLPEDTHRDMPEFSDDDEAVDSIFREYGATPGRTVLLAPYSIGLKDIIPASFWDKLVKELAERGYSLLTNCADDEKPLDGTRGVLIPYNLMVPFLSKAGGFVGTRSGLCDVASGASCKKVVIHTYESLIWPFGNSVVFTGIRNMGLCDDVVEVEYGGEAYESIVNDIGSFFKYSSYYTHSTN